MEASLYNMKKTINNKILKLTTYISLMIPVLIFIRYILGYRMIIFVDLFLTLILLTLLAILWIQKNKSHKLYKSVLIVFMLVLFSGILLPGIEYLGNLKTLYADLLYIFPGIIYISFYIFYYKKGYITLND